MDNLDYHTVMESRIMYFSQKYDPLNKLRNTANQVTKMQQTLTPVVVKKPRARKKILERLDAVIALFL